MTQFINTLTVKYIYYQFIHQSVKIKLHLQDKKIPYLCTL